MSKIDWSQIVDELGSVNLTSQSIVEEEWNDEIFTRSFFMENRLSARPGRIQGLAYGKSLLNWWIGLDNQPPMGDIVLGLFSCMKVPDHDKYLFPDSLYIGGDISLKPPGSELKANDAKTYAAPIYHSTETEGGSSSHTIGIGTTMTKDKVFEWYSSIWSKLEDGSDQNKITSENQKSLNYLGYLAMTLMRCIAKDTESVSSHIFKVSSERFNGFWGEEGMPAVTPSPDIQRLKILSGFFVMARPNTSRVMTHLMTAFKDAPADSTDLVRGILKSACMLSLQQIGLGCLHWLQEAATAQKVSVIQLMLYMATDKNDHMNQSIIKVLTEQVDPKRKQITWAWARIFKTGAFFNLRVAANPKYALIMMVLARKDSNEMWQLPQFASYNEPGFRKEVQITAKAILEDLNQKDLMTGQTMEAKRIAQSIASYGNNNEPDDFADI